MQQQNDIPSLQKWLRQAAIHDIVAPFHDVCQRFRSDMISLRSVLTHRHFCLLRLAAENNAARVLPLLFSGRGCNNGRGGVAEYSSSVNANCQQAAIRAIRRRQPDAVAFFLHHPQFYVGYRVIAAALLVKDQALALALLAKCRHRDKCVESLGAMADDDDCWRTRRHHRPIFRQQLSEFLESAVSVLLKQLVVPQQQPQPQQQQQPQPQQQQQQHQLPCHGGYCDLLFKDTLQTNVMLHRSVEAFDIEPPGRYDYTARVRIRDMQTFDVCRHSLAAFAYTCRTASDSVWRDLRDARVHPTLAPCFHADHILLQWRLYKCTDGDDVRSRVRALAARDSRERDTAFVAVVKSLFATQYNCSTLREDRQWLQLLSANVFVGSTGSGWPMLFMRTLSSLGPNGLRDDIADIIQFAEHVELMMRLTRAVTAASDVLDATATIMQPSMYPWSRHILRAALQCQGVVVLRHHIVSALAGFHAGGMLSHYWLDIVEPLLCHASAVSSAGDEESIIKWVQCAVFDDGACRSIIQALRRPHADILLNRSITFSSFSDADMARYQLLRQVCKSIHAAHVAFPDDPYVRAVYRAHESAMLPPRFVE